jgi:hypothetical protein
MATPENSSPDPQRMGVTPFSPRDPGALELDLLGSVCLEQTAPLGEEHQGDMELDLVEDAGGDCELPVPAPGTRTFLSPAASLA